MMDHKLMEAFEQVVKDMVADGMSEAQAEAIVKRLIWMLICRL